jgi:RimJ/RimL family protein N-acetyltransferase
LERLNVGPTGPRRAWETDVEPLCALLSQPAVAHGYFGAVSAAPEKSAWHVLRSNAERERLCLAESWVACDDAGKPVGYVTVVQGYLAYFVDTACWGRGYGGMLAEFACCETFRRSPDATIRACVFRENRASVRVLEGLGCRFTGLHHPDIVGAYLPVPMLTYTLDTAIFRKNKTRAGESDGWGQV